MYSMKRRIGFSDVSPNHGISLAQAIRYFQDCSTFHSEAVGDGLEVLKEKNCAWLLSAWQIEIEEYPKFAEEIQVNTWPHENKNLFAQRNFEMCREDGTQLMRANAYWFYFDFEKEMPVKFRPEDVACYGVEEKLPMHYRGRKVKLPKGLEGISKEPFQIRKSDLDTNSHTNNAKYIDMALEYVDDNKKIVGMMAEYKKSALLSDWVYPIIYEETDRMYVELRGEDDVFVLIEFEFSGE